MQQAVADKAPYMKGKNKHWFWPLLVLLLGAVVLQQAFQTIASFLVNRLEGDWMQASTIVVPLLLDGSIFLGWTFLMVMYGVGNSVKTYKVVFFILAAFQIFGAASEFIFHRFLLSIISGNYNDGEWGQTLNNIGTILYVVMNAVWFICMLVIVFSRKTGGALRVAALLLALYFLCISIYTGVSPTLLNSLYEQLESQSYTTLLAVINTLHGAAYVATTLFFFAAMSFGKQRQSKRMSAAAQANL